MTLTALVAVKCSISSVSDKMALEEVDGHKTWTDETKSVPRIKNSWNFHTISSTAVEIVFLQTAYILERGY